MNISCLELKFNNLIVLIIQTKENKQKGRLPPTSPKSLPDNPPTKSIKNVEFKKILVLKIKSAFKYLSASPSRENELKM